MNRRTWIIGITIVFLTLIYIWSNSLPSVEQSNQQSGSVLKIIEVIFRTPPLDTEENQHIVRKTAHVLEFGLLGLEMALLMLLTGAMRRQNVMTVLFVGLAAATVDETIQVFTERGSQVADIVLDFAGCLLGIGVGFAIFMVGKRFRGAKKGRK